ncbi:MAG: InlB B-repeat-containing protein, partial [Lachnospiraceae bacterium]|nr:InlB B-repeat-containing protein [Lachnospiraceae bacterium]
MIPGSELRIDQGAKVTVASGKNVYIYDRDEYVGNKFVYSATDLKAVYYSPTRANANKFTAAKMVDAKADVNGTLEAVGKIYTTESGADVTSSEKTGQVLFTTAPTASTTTYQAVQTGTDISYTAIAANACWLHNGSAYTGEDEYTRPAGAAAGTAYFYCPTHDKWEQGASYTITFKANGGTGADYTVQMCGEPGALPAFETMGFEKAGCVFQGWNTAEDGSGTAYADGDPVTLTGDLVLYAQWEGLLYTVTWQDEDGTVLQTGSFEYGTMPVYTDVMPVKAADAEHEYTFAGWTPEPAEVTGDAVYTAVYTESGHSWALDHFVWTAAPENGYTAEAVFACASCGRTETRSAAVSAVTIPAACETAGSVTYTAAVTFDGQEYTDTKTDVIEAIGHDWEAPTYEWAADNSSVIATRVCANDPEHVETETVNTTSEVTK